MSKQVSTSGGKKKSESNPTANKKGTGKKSKDSNNDDDLLLQQYEAVAVAASADLAMKADQQAAAAEQRLLDSAKGFMAPKNEVLTIDTLVPELMAMQLATPTNACWLAYVFHYLVSLHAALGFRVEVHKRPVVRYSMLVYKESNPEEHLWNVLETDDGRRFAVDLSIQQYGGVFAQGGRELSVLPQRPPTATSDMMRAGPPLALSTVLTPSELPNLDVYVCQLQANCLVDAPDVVLTAAGALAEDGDAPSSEEQQQRQRLIAFRSWAQNIKRTLSYRNKNNLPAEIRNLVLSTRMKNEPDAHALERAATNIGLLGDLIKTLVPPDVMAWVANLPLETRKGR